MASILAFAWVMLLSHGNGLAHASLTRAITLIVVLVLLGWCLRLVVLVLLGLLIVLLGLGTAREISISRAFCDWTI